MVGKTTEGTLDLTFPLTQQERKYWVEIYYKDKASAGADFDNKTDEKLFGMNPHEPGTLYRTLVGGNDATNNEALKVEESDYK